MARADLCGGCGTELPPGARYCLKCGHTQSAPLMDLQRIDTAPGGASVAERAVAEHHGPQVRRRRSWLGIVVAVVAIAGAVGVLSTGDGGRNDEAGGSTTTQPAETTTQPPRRTTTTSRSSLIVAQVGAPGPVLGAPTGGLSLYVVGPSHLVRVALDTGTITVRTNAFDDCPPCSVMLGHTVGAKVVDGRLVVGRDMNVYVVEADLRDDPRRLEGVTTEGRFSDRLLMFRNASSPTEAGEVSEFDSEGHVVRTWSLPPGTWAVGAVGDRLVAQSAGRIYLVSQAGEVAPYAVGELIYAGHTMLLWRHCDDQLRCSLSLDDTERGTSTVLPDIGDADYHFFGEPVAPDGRTAAVRVGVEFRLVDLVTGAVLAGFDGVTQPGWSPDGAWFFTRRDANSVVAVSTRSAAQIVIPMPEGVSLGTSELVLTVG